MPLWLSWRTHTLARPTLCIPKNAFVGAPEKSRSKLAAGTPFVQLFEFEDEALQNVYDDEEVTIAHNAWSPADPIAMKVYKLVQLLTADGEASAVSVAGALMAAGHGVVVRQGLGTRDLHRAASTLRNEFVVLQRFGQHPPPSRELIIELNFRSRFELVAGASAKYQSFLATLPDVFVGDIHQLAGLVRTAAVHLAAEYRALQRDIPPWRTASALLSLWLPESARDSSPGVSPAPSIVGGMSPFDSPYSMSPVDSPASTLYGQDSLKLQATKTVYGFETAFDGGDMKMGGAAKGQVAEDDWF